MLLHHIYIFRSYFFASYSYRQKNSLWQDQSWDGTTFICCLFWVRSSINDYINNDAKCWQDKRIMSYNSLSVFWMRVKHEIRTGFMDEGISIFSSLYRRFGCKQKSSLVTISCQHPVNIIRRHLRFGCIKRGDWIALMDLLDHSLNNTARKLFSNFLFVIFIICDLQTP